MIVPLNTLDETYRNIRRDATDQGGCSVLVFVSSDVDAMCAAKILTAMFKTDGIQYKLVPAMGYDDIYENAQRLISDADGLRSVVMLNCGGILDLEQFFELTEDDDVNVYVIDSHRPYHLGNVSDTNTKVWLLHDAEVKLEDYPSEDEDDEELPSSDDDDDEYDFDDGFAVNSDDDDEAYQMDNLDDDGYHVVDGDKENDGDDNDADGGGSSSSPDSMRKRSAPNSVQSRKKRRRRPRMTEAEYEELRQRKQRRATKEAEVKRYYHSSSYGMSAASVVYQIASQLDKSTNPMLWFSIVGTTDQLLHERIDHSTYIQWQNEAWDEVQALNTEPERLDDQRRLEEDLLVESNQSGRIQYNMELKCMLLRHWSLYDAMAHSQYIASRLGVWREVGRQKLCRLLTKLGLPLADAKQQYLFMKRQYKDLLHEQMDKYKDMFGLQDIYYGSFFKQHGKMEISAGDMVYAVTALLEKPMAQEQKIAASGGGDDQTDDQAVTITVEKWKQHFFEAYDALDVANTDVLAEGMELSKEQHKTILRYGSLIFEKRTYTSSGPFRYCILDSGSPDAQQFASPLALQKLGMFLVHALRETMQKKPQPFVIACPMTVRPTYLVVGVSPTGTESIGGPNSFGQAFRKAATTSNARFKHDGFETAMMEIQKDDIGQFMEVLHSGLVSIS